MRATISIRKSISLLRQTAPKTTFMICSLHFSYSSISLTYYVSSNFKSDMQTAIPRLPKPCLGRKRFRYDEHSEHVTSNTGPAMSAARYRSLDAEPLSRTLIETVLFRRLLVCLITRAVIYHHALVRPQICQITKPRACALIFKRKPLASHLDNAPDG